MRLHKDWKLVDVYADEGISGTNTMKREDFKRMIRDCEKGRIDMIITKSISRFARNTLDCLNYIRKLKDMGVGVYFEKENINTMDAKGEILITIMASIAQQESQSISQNTQMGIRYRFKQGISRSMNNNFLGFRTGPDGKMVIEREGADAVRMIYRLFLDGFSPRMIAVKMEEAGLKTGKNGSRWYESTVRGILENEKYMGDTVLQKYYTADFLTKRVVKNRGQLPQYYVENDHDPIVPKEVYLEVQGELLRRSSLRRLHGKLDGYGSRIAFTGRLINGEKGTRYRRYHRKNGETDWREIGVRGSQPLDEEALHRAVIEAFNLLPPQKQTLTDKQKQIRKENIAYIDKVRKECEQEETSIQLEMELFTMHGDEKESDQTVAEEFRQRLDQLKEKRNNLMAERAEYTKQEIHIRNLLDLIRKIQRKEEERKTYADFCDNYDEFFERTSMETQNGPVEEFKEDQVIRYINSILVWGEQIEVRFKAGVSVKVAM